MDIEILNNTLEDLNSKRELYESIAFNTKLWAIILGIIGTGLGVIAFVYNEKKNNVGKEITIINKKINTLKEEEQNEQISELTEKLIFLEYKMTLTQSGVLNPNNQFENILKNDFNLTTEKLNQILDEQISQNKNLLDKAISLNMKGRSEDALNIFKGILKTSNNNYHLALGNSFIGSIYLHTIIVKEENPSFYLKQAEKLFNILPENKNEAISIRKAENYNSIGIYFRRLDEFKLSKDNYESSLSIFKKLNNLYPDKYNLDIGMQYHNLYILLSSYKKSNAIDYLLKAYEFKKSALNDDQYIKSVFLNTTNTLINHYFHKKYLNIEKANTYFNESEEMITKVFKSEKKINGTFIESTANLYANYGFHLKNNSENQVVYENGISLMLKSLSYFEILKENNYPISKLMYSNLLHNLGCEYEYDKFSFEFCNANMTEAISIREQLASSIPGKQYEVALADSYLVISKLYFKYKKSRYSDFAKKAKKLYSKYMDDDEFLRQYFTQANSLII
tara:strand:- start:45568 stop:47091 length:1524 start_codon:yes stop_codon:yes gene_type:complete